MGPGYKAISQQGNGGKEHRSVKNTARQQGYQERKYCRAIFSTNELKSQGGKMGDFGR
jgi:hypothetical protein